MKIHDELSDSLIRWIKNQEMFFVGSSPLKGKFINISPKGLDGTLAVIDRKTVAYLDSIGSGNETLSHIREPGNSRVCIMFCAFTGAPRIVRLHGYGRFVPSGTEEFDSMVSKHFDLGVVPSGVYRGMIVTEAFQISTSCGKGVPLYEYSEQRESLGKSALNYANKGSDNLANVVEKFNTSSLDGLPGLERFDQAFVHKNPKEGNEIAPSTSSRLDVGLAVGSFFALTSLLLMVSQSK